MTPGDLALVVLYAALLVVALLGADRIGKALGFAPEGRRKIVHVALGLAVLTLPFVFSEPLPVVVLGALCLVVLAAARRSRRLGAALHDVERSSLGEVYFAVSVVALFVLQAVGVRAAEAATAVNALPAVFFIVPIAIMTLADTAAALAGTEYGKRIFVVEKGSKSLEGTVAFFFVTWLTALILLLLMTEIPRDAVVTLSGFLALAGASIEAESWAGLDNLFVPLGLHIILVSLAPANMVTILLYALGYGAAVAVGYRVAKLKDVAQQPLRAAILLVTVFLMGFGLINTLLLVAAVGMTMIANRIAPPAERHADLHTVFAIVAIGLFWLIAGNASGRNLIVFFSIAIAIYGAAMTAIALRRRPVWAGLALVAICVVLAARLHLDVMVVDSALMNTLIGVAGIITVSALCLMRLRLFARHRALKVTLLALGFSALSALAMVIQ